VPVTLERTGDGYAFRLGLRAGFGGQEVARVPVHRRANTNPHPILKEIHSCEVAGQTLEAANVHALRAKVVRALDSLAPARTLPLCWFRAPAAAYELAVYEQGSDVVCPLLSGPKLRSDDLAGIRRMVCRHLISAGYVNDPDEVTVGVLQPRDLRRVAPAAVFRSHGDQEVWLPAVEGVSPDGAVLGVLDHAMTLGARSRRRGGGPAPRDGLPVAPDVIALLRGLRGEWARRRRLAEPGALYASEVRADVWATAEARNRDAGTRLVAHVDDLDGTTLELPVRRTGAGELVTALEERGITVLLASDEHELAKAVGRHLAAGGFLREGHEVEVLTVAPPRPERLDPNTIWTNHGGVAAAAREVEEAHP
jgi:KAP family P-loop domain